MDRNCCSRAISRPAMRTYVEDTRGGAPMPVTAEGVAASRVSPDGKYVTAVDGGKLNLLPIAGASRKRLWTCSPENPCCAGAPMGAFCFCATDEGLTAVKINRLDLASRREEPWKELKPADPVGVRIGMWL
jgi:hypothetical protein